MRSTRCPLARPVRSVRPARLARPIRCAALAMLAALLTQPAAAAPQWLWSGPKGQAKGNEVVLFRKAFEVSGKVNKAELLATCDNTFNLFINGKQASRGTAWETPYRSNVASLLKPGKNVIAVHAANGGGNVAGFVAQLTLTLQGGKKAVIETDKTWKMAGKEGATAKTWNSATFDDSKWKPAVEIGKMGTAPWGNVFAGKGKAPSGRAKTPGPVTMPADIKLPKGFKIELLYVVPRNEQGSWVSLTKGPNGVLFASDQGNKGIYQITPVKPGAKGQVTKVEKLPLNISNAQGMVWAFDSLYVNRNGSGSGVWRITDSDRDGKLDKADHIVPLQGGGEHGPHDVILTEDGKELYICGGNHTAPPPDLTASRVPLNWSEDHLLPRQWDARGHARGKLAPGGWVARISKDGKKRELVTIGYRNQYGIAVNPRGDIFTFDSDMEWDFGMPWYRPTRICHSISGGDFGWRSGTGKWPVHYPDTVPPVADIGPASPTGVTFGYGAKFPAKWEQALYALDWTYGTIWAVHLKHDGAGYGGDVQEFVSGAPLPVTDAVVGDDGAFYFAIGGRNTQSALYRVTYQGDEGPAVKNDADLSLLKLRKSLESYHGKKHPHAVSNALKNLGHEDRYIRHAARIALESQPVVQWRSKVGKLTEPLAVANAVVALARQGHRGDDKQQGDLPAALEALSAIDLSKVSTTVQLDALRAYALSFVRLGKPNAAQSKALIAKLDPLYPHKHRHVNAELARLLVYLQSPTVVSKTMSQLTNLSPQAKPQWATVLGRNSRYGGSAQRMLDNMPHADGLNLAFMLRNATVGWTVPQRKAYHKFINTQAQKSGGNSYAGFLKNIRAEALANTPGPQRALLADVTGESLDKQPKFAIKPPKGPGKEWTVKSAMAVVDKKGLRKRDFNNGRNAFFAVGCAACHKMGDLGGAVGPGLSNVAGKFSPRDLLESIIEPSKVISDQYGSSIVTKNDGTQVLGLVVDNDGNNPKSDLIVFTPDINTKPVVINKSQVKSVKESPQSQMPAGLANLLNEDELLDLLAYLLSSANPKDRMFR